MVLKQRIGLPRTNKVLFWKRILYVLLILIVIILIGIVLNKKRKMREDRVQTIISKVKRSQLKFKKQNKKAAPKIEDLRTVEMLLNDIAKYIETKNYTKAIDLYEKAAQKGYYEGYYEIARLYHSEETMLNSEMAVRYYIMFIRDSSDDYKKNLSRIYISDLFQENPYLEDMYAMDITAINAAELQRKQDSENNNPLRNNRTNDWIERFEDGRENNRDLPNNRNRLNDLNDIEAINRMFDEAFTAIPVLPAEITRDNDYIPNDTQNVHDHGVQNTIKRSIDAIRSKTGLTIPKDESYRQIEKMVLKENSGNAYRALQSFSDTPMSKYNMSEKDALHLVWNYINRVNDPDIRKSMEKSLVQELNECVENNGVVCTTGKFTRVIGAMDGFDESVSIKPMWAIDQEISSKVSRIYDNMYQSLNDADKDKYMKDDTFSDEFNKRFKEESEKTILKDYGEILEKPLLQSAIEKWTTI